MSPARGSGGRLWMLAIPAVLLALASSWILPARLLLQSGGSPYLFAIVGDEVYYAERMQIPIAETNSINPFNGLGDARVISPFFLESGLREIITLLHIDIFTFCWMWRLLFPLAMFGTVWWATNTLLGRRRNRPLAESAIMAALAYGWIMFSYDLLVDFPTLQGWIMRIPTGVEYLLALGILGSLWRMLLSGTLRNALVFALVVSLAAYLRPFTVIPWAPACALAFGWALWRRRLKPRPLLAGFFTGMILAAPFIAVLAYNQGFEVVREAAARNFGVVPYGVHYRWLLFVLLGAGIAASAWLLRGRARSLVFVLGAALTLLPFYAGLPATTRRELLGFDRFGYYYLLALAAALLLVLRRYGNLGRAPRRGAVAAAGAGALIFSGAVLLRGATFNLDSLPQAAYQPNLREMKYIDGYRWVAEHTPEDAWVLLDDGVDWSAIAPGDAHSEVKQALALHEDLFSIIARRKRYTVIRLYGAMMSDTDLHLMRIFQHTSFGLRTTDEAATDSLYFELLKACHPDYIFWRREAPLPRGRAGRMQPASEIVYSDAACEIWKLHWPDVLRIFKPAHSVQPAHSAHSAQPATLLKKDD